MRQLAACACLLTASCGYHVSGRGDLLPSTIRTIAVPSFGNVTTRYKLADRLPSAITRELISRTRYSVVADPRGADAILDGAVVNYSAFPTIFDGATGRASGMQVIVVLQLKLTEQASGKVIFNRPTYEARSRFEISADQIAYFDESNTSLDRMATEVARMVVSSILEGF